MSRDWLAVYTGILGRPKYRRLSIPARAALFHVWLLAGAQAPEATWANREELADVLELDGYPADVIDELLLRRWLDEDPGGRILVHDWDHWQLAAAQAIQRAYEADRKGKWRRARTEAAPLSPAPLSRQKQDITSHDITESPGHVRDIDGKEPSFDGEWAEPWRPFLKAWTDRGYRYPPSENQREKLWPIVDASPNDAAVWLLSAPVGAKPFDADNHVFKRWTAHRDSAA